MSGSVLIDTNVILDVWFERKPFFQASVQVLDAIERGKVSGLVDHSDLGEE